MGKLLPTFAGARGGSGCDNPDCDASPRHIRVLSVHELDRTYPQKSTLPYWPIPPQATHVCDRCGYVYEGYSGQSDVADEVVDVPPFDPDEWEFEPADVYGGTVREAIECVVEARPPDAAASDVQDAVARSVPGASRDDALEVLSAMDVDMSLYDASEFM